ncbi:MAG: hypothetical protein SH850_15200 [Planctomycetaceae bacterium]|nr:hypothetical protein [Planctomycetaceae bacterium]
MTKICPMCGAEMEVVALQCSGCGEALPEKDAPKRGKRTPRWVLLATLFFGAFGAFFFLLRMCDCNTVVGQRTRIRRTISRGGY